MRRVYVATGYGLVSVAVFPVSHTTLPVSSTDMFAAIVYVAEFNEQDATTSTAVGGDREAGVVPLESDIVPNLVILGPFNHCGTDHLDTAGRQSGIDRCRLGGLA